MIGDGKEKTINHYDPTTRPTVMIYRGIDDCLYTNVPMNIDKIAITELGESLTPDDLVELLESANIVWVQFDAKGVFKRS